MESVVGARISANTFGGEECMSTILYSENLVIFNNTLEYRAKFRIDHSSNVQFVQNSVKYNYYYDYDEDLRLWNVTNAIVGNNQNISMLVVGSSFDISNNTGDFFIRAFNYNVSISNNFLNQGYIEVGANYSSIISNTIQNQGILSCYGDYNMIANNTLNNTSAVESFFFKPDSKGNEILDNRLYGEGVFSMQNFWYLNTLKFESGEKVVFQNNTLNNNQVGYFQNESDIVIESSFEQLFVIDCKNVSIEMYRDSRIYHTSYILKSDSIRIYNSTFHGRYTEELDIYPLLLIIDCSFFEIENCRFENNNEGLYVLYSNNGSIVNNTFLDISNYLYVKYNENIVYVNNTLINCGCILESYVPLIRSVFEHAMISKKQRFSTLNQITNQIVLSNELAAIYTNLQSKLTQIHLRRNPI